MSSGEGMTRLISVVCSPILINFGLELDAIFLFYRALLVCFLIEVDVTLSKGHDRTKPRD